MTQGISNSLNTTLMRINSIENNFAALENISAQINNTSQIQNSASTSSAPDFQTILNSKIKEAQEDNAKTKEAPEVETIDEIEEQSPVNLKSKINLKAQQTNVEEIIETLSNKYNVNSDFIKAIIKQESGFNCNATSKKGAMGLMQLMPATAKSLGVVDAYNPSENVEGGVKYLKGLLDRFGNDEKLALAAYNAGPNTVKKYGGIPPYKETQNYVNSIMNTYNKLKGASSDY